MQEHNFEKQVQQKMEELSITPSAPVWQKVEEEIRKKKDRRRFAFWLTPLLLICGGLSWWALQTSDLTSAANTPPDKQASGEFNSRKPTLPVLTDPSKSAGNTSDTTDQAHKSEPPPVAMAAYKPFREKSSKSVRTTAPVFIVKNNSLPSHATNDHSDVAEETEETIAEKAPRLTFQPSSESLIDSSVTRETASSTPEIEISKENLQPETAEKTPDTLLVAGSKARSSDGKKWQWNIHGSAGISSVKRGLFYSNTLVLDYYQTPAAGGIPPAAGGIPPTPPSEVRKGTAFSFGIALKRNTSERLSFTGGLQYHLFSTRMNTGIRINRDTVINNNASYRDLSGYYQTGRQEEYQNNYHFIELPVGMEYQLFRKLPLRLHAGLVWGRLVSTNALVYDRRNNIYYEDNSVLNKNQWQIFANLNYKVLNTSKGSLHLGPYLQYGFRGLEKEAQGKNYYLFSAGLRTHVSF